MRKLYLLLIFITISLLDTAEVCGNVNVHTKHSSVTATAPDAILSTAFKPVNAELELTTLQAFTPAQITLEKKADLFLTKITGVIRATVNNSTNYTYNVSTAIFKRKIALLFPFHHFW